MAQVAENDGASVDYREAIERAKVGPASNRRPELGYCIKQWGTLPTPRTGLPGGSPTGAGAVVLEVGNSGFPRYEYVRVDGFLLQSSYSASVVDVSQTRLGKRLKELYASTLSDFGGSADSELDDGDCYYLTVNGDSRKVSVAIYGPPGTTQSGLLIKELLDMARSSGPSR